MLQSAHNINEKHEEYQTRKSSMNISKLGDVGWCYDNHS